MKCFKTLRVFYYGLLNIPPCVCEFDLHEYYEKKKKTK